ncbi:unnamed protein product [Thlaspi arvense]|uniref:MADS-box domain-containing protein n=1 Tax=Thlaspi arvense TaxID=13288 RepID=A0AAU9RM99_THLAR|nr:unnamed protein product [Thlaspi arvense]
MSREKIEIKDIEKKSSQIETFFEHLDGLFREVDAQVRLCNFGVGILVDSPTGQPYVFKCPCFNSVAACFGNPYSRRSKRSSPSSLRQARILKSQAKLDRLTDDLERQKEIEEFLDRQLEAPKSYNGKKTIDLTLEELIALKEKFEVVLDNMKHNNTEMKEAT